ncbi:MAG: proteasome assembly chaperone family protein [Candidatus Asgardarchaeia archaeon]
METIVREVRKMRLKEPILIEGLPGIGLVGKIAAKYMAKTLKAKRMAEIYSPHFPHQVIMRKKGTVRMLRNVIYGWKGKEKELMILIGDVQPVTPEGQFEVNSKILDYFEAKGGKLIYTLGGYSTGKLLDRRRVLGVVTHKELIPALKKNGVVFGEAKGTIVGAAGMLLGLGMLRGMKGACLMGETHGAYVDSKSAKNLLQTLTKILNVDIDLKRLDERVKVDESVMKKISDQILKPTQGSQDLSYIR